MGSLGKLLLEAFPRDEKGMPYCRWCGATRDGFHALCRACWFRLHPDERAQYLSLGLEERAKFLLSRPLAERRRRSFHDVEDKAARTLLRREEEELIRGGAYDDPFPADVYRSQPRRSSDPRGRGPYSGLAVASR